MCNCLKRVLKELEPKLKPKEEVLEFKIGWKGQVLRFDGGCPVGLYVESEYRSVKVNGTPYKNMTKNENFVAMSFCPFCGESLTESSDGK